MPMEMNIAQAASFIEEVALGMREPVLMEGGPGLGKTDITYQVAEKNGCMWHGTRFSQVDSIDLRGAMDISGEMTTWKMPEDIPVVGNPNFPTDRPILWMLDELGSVQQSTYPLVMEVLNERSCNSRKILDNVVIVAATNRSSDRATSSFLPSTVQNRLTHINIVPDRDAWCDWWLAQSGPAGAVAQAFYHFRPELFYTFDPKQRESNAFATPRTNVKMWKAYLNPNLSEFNKKAAMMGAVGDGVALEALAFIKVWQAVLTIKEILADPEGVVLPTETSMMYATTVSVSGNINRKTAKPLGIFLKRFRDKHPEFETLAWTLAARRTDNTKDDITDTDAYFEWARVLKQVYKG